MSPKTELTPEALRSCCDPGRFEFKTTDELAPLEGIIGQQRAIDALHFGIRMPGSGYNLFALGPAGIGKFSAVEGYLNAKARTEPAPPDLCYVNNFDDDSKPVALQLPAGRGRALRHDTEQLVEELRPAIRAAFDSESYRARAQQIDNEFERLQQEAFVKLQNHAEQQAVKLLQSPGEITFAPLKHGKVVDPEAFQKLPADEQERIQATVEKLQIELREILQKRIPQWRKERRARIKKLHDEVTLDAVGHLIDLVRQDYRDLPEVQKFLDAIQHDVVLNAEHFSSSEESDENPESAGSGHLLSYTVNLLVDHADSQGAPVVYEDNPSYANLLGRVEHLSQFGALITNFTLIKAGALHRANGGYLVLDARKLLTQPYAWEALKRTLSSGQIRIESLGQALSLISTISLEPSPLDLSVKIVLLGDRLLYYLLCELDPDFKELFKVAADFEDHLDRTPEHELLYAQLIATLARKDNLLPFDRTAVAAVIEQSMRLSEDTGKLTTHMGSIADLLRESSFWAGEAGHGAVARADVERAIADQIRRADRIRDRYQEAILRGTVRIEVEGSVAGQINGLTTIQIGDFVFGVPARITANTRIGEGELIDIEREVELGGPIHSKGVFILSSYLGARFARDIPLSLSASLVFEQSYNEVEGDSASLAELCALQSSVADLPLSQALAVTGSVDQHGNVQAVGGVNEKIEGFFDVCRPRGLTGDQGVLLPAKNAPHLMLRAEVVDAVRQGQFHIYLIDHVDEAMALLTGLPAGTQDADGGFPEDTVNGQVLAALHTLADLRQQYATPRKDEESTSEHK